MSATSCLELIEILPKLDDLTDPFWTHVRACGRCLQAVSTMDPSFMATAGRGDKLRPAVVDPEVYSDLEPFVRGGMYQTWTTVDRRLGRQVVIKGLPDPALDAANGREGAGFDADEPAKRLLLDACLRREALMLAGLQHPSIVTLLEAGQWRGGESFYAMERVEGITLQEEVGKHQTLRERLDLLPALTTVARAVAHTHARGVAHRDLSPNNILVGAGTATVIDWTTAKRVDGSIGSALVDAAELPETGPTLAALGTPGYAPAEQASSGHDHRVDIFALGATLQFLVTGKNPFGDGTRESVMANVARARRIEPVDCPPALAAIIRKATEHRPEDRYATAGEFADDLQRFQSDQLVLAHRYTAFERFVHSRLFKPLLVAMLVLLVGGAGTLATLHFRDESVAAVRNAGEARDEAIAANDQARAAIDETAAETIKLNRALANLDKAETELRDADDTKRLAQVALLKALSAWTEAGKDALDAQRDMNAAVQQMRDALAAQGEAETARDIAESNARVAQRAEAQARDAEAVATHARLVAERREHAAVATRDELEVELGKALGALVVVRADLASATRRIDSLSTQLGAATEERGEFARNVDALTTQLDKAVGDRAAAVAASEERANRIAVVEAELAAMRAQFDAGVGTPAPTDSRGSAAPSGPDE
jgi:hypothetical protein